VHTTYDSDIDIDHIGHSVISSLICDIVITNVLHVPKARILFLFIKLLWTMILFLNFTTGRYKGVLYPLKSEFSQQVHADVGPSVEIWHDRLPFHPLW
jgi:hypothetical protein